MDAFRPVTCAAEVISDGAIAPYQIDAALSAAMIKRAPAYLEINEDVWRATCDARFLQIPLATEGNPVVSAPSSVDAAVAACISMFKKYIDAKQCARPVYWVGHEIHRQNLQSDLEV